MFFSRKPLPLNRPIEKLEPTYLNKLRLWQGNYGKYIKLKFGEVECRNNIVEGTCSDDIGDTIDVKVYFYDKGEAEQNCQSYFKRGTVIYIKEQFYKIAMTKKNYIRVDSFRCLEF